MTLKNKVKPAINTQYNNFSSILRLHKYNKKNPSRKQGIINENETDIENNIQNITITHVADETTRYHDVTAILLSTRTTRDRWQDQSIGLPHTYI